MQTTGIEYSTTRIRNMRAIHKYKTAARRGDREAQRRIAQSYGYKTTIHDMPHMIALMKRAGIELLESETTPSTTEFVDDATLKGQGGEVVDTIKL